MSREDVIVAVEPLKSGVAVLIWMRRWMSII